MIEFLESLGLFGLFIASFLAATIVPFSSDVLLYGFFLTQISPLNLLAVATLGNTLGGLSSYGLGLLAKWHFLEKYFRVKKNQVLGWQKNIERYGFYLALLCWLPIIGDVLAVALGFFRVKIWPVVFGMFIGKALRYFVVYWIYVYWH